MRVEPTVGRRPAWHAGPEVARRSEPAYTPLVHFLFVCTANICRSPMAAALFAEQIENLTDPVEVSSAGSAPARIGRNREVPTRCSR